jgi:hypothetical protein
MAKAKAGTGEQGKDEKIGFHKGSLSVLAKERQELQRMIAIVEQLMQMHLAELKDLGVDLSKEAEKMKAAPEKKPPIDEIL